MKGFLTLILAAVSCAAMAQDTVCQKNDLHKGLYLTFGIGGGAQTDKLDFSNPENTFSSGAGICAGAGLQYFFTNHIGVGAGLSIRSLKSEAVLNYTTTQENVDTDGETYVHNTSYQDLLEKQSILTMGIPVELLYQGKFGKSWKFLGGIGLKPTFQLSGKTEVTGGNIATHGYYSRLDVDFYDMENHNFKNYDDLSGDISTKPSVNLIGDLQLMYALTHNIDLVLGLNAELGLNDIHENDNLEQFDFKSEAYNGVLKTSQVSDIKQMVLGAQVGIRIRFGKCGETNSKPKDVEPDQPVVTPTDVADTEEAARRAAEEKARLEAEEAERARKEAEAAEKEKARQAEETKIANEAQNVKEAVADLKPIKFENTGSTVPANKQKSGLDQLAETMNSNPDITLEITGHTCDLGSEEVNKKVGLDRAEWVKAELVKRGVSADRISTATKWFTEPLVPNTSEDNRKINRRVEIKVVRK